MMNRFLFIIVGILYYNLSLLRCANAQQSEDKEKKLYNLLMDKEVFKISFSNVGSYVYEITDVKGSVDVAVKNRPTKSISGNLPLYISKSKRIISSLNLNVYRSSYETGQVNSIGLDEETVRKYEYVVSQSDNLSISPTFIYNFKIRNKSALIYSRFKLYGDGFGNLADKSWLIILNLLNKNDADKTLGWGLGMNIVNSGKIVCFPLFTYNKPLRHSLYLNMTLPHKLDLVYLPNKSFNARIGCGLNLLENIHQPFVANHPVLKIDDLAFDKHIMLSKKIYKRIWMKAWCGHNTILRSELKRLKDGNQLYTNKSSSSVIGEMSISLLF